MNRHTLAGWNIRYPKATFRKKRKNTIAAIGRLLIVGRIIIIKRGTLRKRTNI
jgi:hypothetical protein